MDATQMNKHDDVNRLKEQNERLLSHIEKQGHLISLMREGAEIKDGLIKLLNEKIARLEGRE